MEYTAGGRGGLRMCRSCVFHRAYSCHLGLPSSSSASVQAKLVIRGLSLRLISLKPIPGSETLSAVERLRMFCRCLPQAACPLRIISWCLKVPCSHLMYIYSQGPGASAGSWSLSEWMAQRHWERFIISTFLGYLTWEILGSWCGEEKQSDNGGTSYEMQKMCSGDRIAVY
jgi:hypothetical protein